MRITQNDYDLILGYCVSQKLRADIALEMGLSGSGLYKHLELLVKQGRLEKIQDASVAIIKHYYKTVDADKVQELKSIKRDVKKEMYKADVKRAIQEEIEPEVYALNGAITHPSPGVTRVNGFDGYHSGKIERKSPRGHVSGSTLSNAV